MTATQAVVGLCAAIVVFGAVTLALTLRERRRARRRAYALGPARNDFGLPVAGQPGNYTVYGSGDRFHAADSAATNRSRQR